MTPLGLVHVLALAVEERYRRKRSRTLQDIPRAPPARAHFSRVAHAAHDAPLHPRVLEFKTALANAILSDDGAVLRPTYKDIAERGLACHDGAVLPKSASVSASVSSAFASASVYRPLPRPLPQGPQGLVSENAAFQAEEALGQKAAAEKLMYGTAVLEALEQTSDLEASQQNAVLDASEPKAAAEEGKARRRRLQRVERAAAKRAAKQREAAEMAAAKRAAKQAAAEIAAANRQAAAAEAAERALEKAAAKRAAKQQAAAEAAERALEKKAAMENAAAVKAERAAACRAAKDAAQRVADGGHKHPDAKIRATVRAEQYEHLLDDLEDNPCAFYDSREFD